MLGKLELMPLENLIRIKELVDGAVRQKMASHMRPGNIVTFVNNDRKTVGMVVQRLNGKTISGYEYDLATHEHYMRKRWRVSYDCVKPYFPPPKAKPIPAGVGSDRPEVASTW